ncbi:MAG: site-specific integrase [Planctomycetales bacterium]
MRVFRAKYKGRNGKQKVTAKWYVEFRDHLETVHRVPAFTDKKQSEEFGRKLDKLVESRMNNEPPGRVLRVWIETLPGATRKRLGEIGILDTSIVTAGKPLVKHLEDFETSLRNGDRCDKHIRQVINKVRWIVDQCKVTFWHELTKDKVEKTLKQVITSGKSKQTRNHYFSAIRQFCLWMVEIKRAAENPVASLKAISVDDDRRHERRTLTVDEFHRLVSTTHDEPERYGLSGSARAILYILASETGFRASELRSLKRASFALKDDPPTVRCKAGYVKSGKTSLLPLSTATARWLAPFLANKLPEARAFNVPKSDRTAEMLREDLDAARNAWLAAQIPLERIEAAGSDFLLYRSHEGLVADFHSLRGQFITNLSKTGTHLPLAQALARHSTPTLTSNVYTHKTLADKSEAIERLPRVTGVFDESVEQKATGTDGAIVNENDLASCLAQKEPDGRISVQ